MVTRHTEFSINFDLTCGAIDLEDFNEDTPRSILEDVLDYLHDDPTFLFDKIKINKVWYEREVN